MRRHGAKRLSGKLFVGWVQPTNSPEKAVGFTHPTIVKRPSRIASKNADYRGGVTCLYDTQLLGAACMHPSPVAALALRPSGACQTYQSPPQPPGPILFGTRFDGNL